MRTLVDIPEEDIRWLDSKAERDGTSRTALVREAVAAYRAEAAKDWLDHGFGVWKQRTDVGDAVAEQRRSRAEWVRPGDADYEETRKEFPDLFDEDDDREHRRLTK